MDINKKTFAWAIIGLIVIRIIMLVLLLNNIPPTDMQPTWRPNFGGSYWPDERVFFDLAKSLTDFKPAESIIYIGYSIFLAPFIYFTGATAPAMIAKPLVLVQGILFFSLSMILIALIGLRFFKSRKLALIAASVFLIYPYIVYGLWKLIGHRNAIPTFQYQMWIVILSDYLSAFLVLLTFWLFIKFIESFEELSLKPFWYVAMGVMAGLAGLVRPPNLAIAAFIFLYLFYFKKIKGAFIFSVSALTVYLPQLIYNTYFFKWPWVYGDVVLSAGLPQSGKSLSGLWEVSNLWLNFRHFSPNHYFLFFLLVTTFSMLILVFGLRYLSKTNKKLIPIFAFWFLFYFLFYGMFEGSFSQLRYFLPIIPLFICFVMATVLYLFSKFEINYLDKIKKQYKLSARVLASLQVNILRKGEKMAERRIVDAMTAYKLTVKVLCDSVPTENEPHIAYLMSQTEFNQDSVFGSALDLYKQKRGELFVAIMSGEARMGYPGEIVWKRKLNQLGIHLGNIFSIPSPLDNLNTFTEAQSLVRLAKERTWPSVYIVAPPFHQVRSFISTVTVALQEYPKLKIYNKVGKTLDWNKEGVHSQGITKGIRDDFIDGEWDRIEKYENLVSPEEALLYLINRDK